MLHKYLNLMSLLQWVPGTHCHCHSLSLLLIVIVTHCYSLSLIVKSLSVFRQWEFYAAELWLPPNRLIWSFPSKWKSKSVFFVFGFWVHSPLGKERTTPCYFHLPEHFLFLSLVFASVFWLFSCFFSRQSIPIPDQIQPLFLFQVSVIHSDFYFLSVFASGGFALLLSYSLLSAFVSIFYSSFLAVFPLHFRFLAVSCCHTALKLSELLLVCILTSLALLFY